MKIEVLLFANLADYLPPGTRGSSATLDLPEGASAADLVRRLAIPAELPCLVLINGRDAELDRRLAAGDVVSLIPPLAGGSAAPGPPGPAGPSAGEPARVPPAANPVTAGGGRIPASRPSSAARPAPA